MPSQPEGSAIPVQFPDWLGRQRDVRDTIQQRSSSCLFCRRPLWAFMAWAGMFTLRCPSSTFSADHGVAYPQRCPEGWFWRGCHGTWHNWTVQVSISWQLPEEVHVDTQGVWSCLALSCRSCAPSRTRRCVKVSSGTLFQKPGSFLQSQQGGSMFHHEGSVKTIQWNTIHHITSLIHCSDPTTFEQQGSALYPNFA